MQANIHQSIRVLVVDDESSVRDAYRQILSDPTPSADRAALDDMRSRLFRQSADSRPPAGSPARLDQFKVDLCEDADAAVEACKTARDENQPFAVVFLDMRMPPGPDGAWAAEQIRAIDRDVEIVVCTAFSDVDPATISQRAPPAEKLFYLQKPFHPHAVRALAIALGHKWCAERRIARLAYFDGLTGLPNRTLFHEQLSAAIEIAEAQEQKLALLYFDLDNFKRINDTLGHGAGDELLCLMAARLSKMFRREDLVGRPNAPAASTTSLARMGGDEFVVLVHDVANQEEAGIIAERVVQTLLEPMQVAMHQVLVTPSVGIAIYPANGTDVETLFRKADLAMYFAKRQGPGRVAYFNETMSSGGLLRLTLENKLRDALARKEFALRYQPQFDLRTGVISGFEALLRWTNAELGSVSPVDFIPVAEETGLILPIGAWVLRSACAQMKTWHDEGLLNGHVAVNVSGLQFAQPNFPALVATVLRETGLPPACLELEVTESMVMQDETSARQTFAQLRQLGVSVAIDDFGSGYSSLGRLRQIPVDRLKIDRSFVRDLQANTEDRALVKAIIKMAQTLGLGVIAEGVEHFSQLLYLQEEQCDAAQGFLLAQPLSAAEAVALLKTLVQTTDTSRTQRLAKLLEVPRAVNLD